MAAVGIQTVEQSAIAFDQHQVRRQSTRHGVADRLGGHQERVEVAPRGAGRYRGGLGQTLELESSEGAPVAVFLSLERVKYPARGRAGGGEGACGHISFSSGEVLSGKGEFELSPGDTFIMHTPGGGGFGDPAQRAREAVEEDLKRGFITQDQAVELYGYTPTERPSSCD